MLNRIQAFRQIRLVRTTLGTQYPGHRCFATKTFDPLRILFCGSDNFSIASLDAILHAAEQNPSFIHSIEVVARPGKWTGHQRKIFKEVPIADRARGLGLPLHQIDTFRGWTPLAKDGLPFNLILAVSFGLLIPRRIIESAKYGGLNVHPSMLPDLWGAAPLHHALLNEDKYIGMTIQTLHPTKMDNGAIVAQTPDPGFEITSEARQSFSSLADHTAPLAANFLISTLEQGLFHSPVTDLTPQAISRLQGRQPRHARKLVLEDRHIDWDTWSAHKIVYHQKLFKSLWNTVQTSDGIKNLVWTGEFTLADPATRNPSFPPGVAYWSEGDSVFINSIDGAVLQVYDCTIARDRSRTVHRIGHILGIVEEDSNQVKRFKVKFE